MTTTHRVARAVLLVGLRPALPSNAAQRGRDRAVRPTPARQGLPPRVSRPAADPS